ncbi:MAG: PAS domain-containing protein [Candidatus Zixiibacteriota bacterium]|nr:MAG: PAS domain-containing protein [candidate division Zixibacteria bacterium]
MDKQQEVYTSQADSAIGEVAQFTESYASFNRIINSLQRQYIELKEEFQQQNDQLAETNRQLVEVTRRNLAVTEFLDSILSSISAGVIAIDHNGLITQFNPAASALLGIPGDDPVGLPYREVIPPGTPREANALRAMETGQTVDTVEKTVELMDGSCLHLSVSTAILRTEDARAMGAVEVFHDLSRVKKMEAEIARLNTLAALGEMAATIAHQVRNPLAGIGGFAALLKRDLEEDDPRQKTVNKIIQGVESLNNTVSTLLNYTRSAEVHKEELDFNEFLASCVEGFLHEHCEMVADFRIEVAPPERTAPEPLLTALDSRLFRELLNSVFTNAMEACDGTGVVTISCRKLPRQSAAQRYGNRLLLGLDETVIEIIIDDNGPGIEPRARESLFRPFFTTKQGGCGLGLAMAWKIVKAHGGDLLADDRQEGGARFTILLPTRIEA